jgi:VanZ family protein
LKTAVLEPNRAAPAASSGWPLAWGAWLLFVVYGSLVPLEFRALDPAVAWQRFLQTPMLELGVDKRADWVANGVLYVPVGFLTAVVWMGAQAGAARRMAAVLGAVLLGWALALAVEFAQLFFPPRTASLNDLLAEGLGTVVGAALAWRGSGWARRFLPALRTHWPAVAGSLLPAYAAVLVLLGLFPFDLLLSGQELAAKWQGGLWGPWLAPALAEVSGLRLLVRLAVETLVVVPLGWLWARRAQGASPLQALVLGGLFGLGLEALQLLVASGVSQGVSVLTRALGWALGNWLWLGRTARPLAWWRTQGLRWRWPWAGAHLLALAWLAGWFGSPVLGAAQAVARLAGDEIRFLPLYYHYYTTEAVALASLTAVALMYAPAGAWLWVRGQASVGGAAALGAAVAGVVETGKLFFQAARPDPTNVLVAAAAAALALWALQRVAAAAAGHAGAVGDAGDAGDAGAGGTSVAPARAATAAAAPPARRPPPRSSLRLAPLGLAVAVALAAAWFANAPLPNLVLGALALATSALVWWRPVLVFALRPVALPLRDLARRFSSRGEAPGGSAP